MGREKCGFHVFRRFRASWLRKNRVPRDLEKMWMGHAHKDLTDQYAEQLREDVKYRRKWCERIGLGFYSPMCHNFRNQSLQGKQHEVVEFEGDKMVGANGFEPSTSWSRTRRASQAALRPDI
jgi:hypothetical protein